MNASSKKFKDRDKESRLFIFRGRLLLVFIFLALLLLLARMAYLQVFQYDHYSQKSETNRTSVEVLPPIRGLIYDRNGQLLAENQPSHSLSITLELADNLSQTLERICQILELEEGCEDNLKERSYQRQRPYEPALLVDQLTEEQMALIAVNKHLLPGVEITAQLLRYYPKAESLAHVLGYVGRISKEDLSRLDRRNYSGTHFIGKTGLESFYENILHGKVGYKKIETNAHGKIINLFEEVHPQTGKDLHLHLDSSLQERIYQLLDGRKAAVVAIETATGGVLALVSSPSFNPNTFIGSLDGMGYLRLERSANKPLFNRAISGQYSPGSTIKPMLALAALENEVITPDFEINDRGFYQLPNDKRMYRNWRRWGHGKVNLNRAITVSNNTYFYHLAYHLGIDAMYDFMTKMGFGQVTDLDIQGSKSGLMPSREWKRNRYRQPWFPGETLSTGIGQGYWLATPLQLATAVNFIANKGKWVAPKLAIEDRAKVTDKSKANKLSDINLQDQSYWEEITQAMTNVMHNFEGTARFAGQGAKYLIAGKTGTSQIYTLSQEHKQKKDVEIPEHLRDHALFIGFAPADNPKITLALIVENGGSGSQVAAPLARQIFDLYLDPEQSVIR